MFETILNTPLEILSNLPITLCHDPYQVEDQWFNFSSITFRENCFSKVLLNFQVVHDMLTGPSGSLTAKKSSIEKLQNAISVMQQHMPCAA